MVLLAMVLWVAPASADLFVSGSSGAGLLASANFAVVDVAGSTSNLVVTLTNTSLSDVLVPADVLTALFWQGTSGLGSVSALLNGGSTVIYDLDGQPAGGIVGGEWAYGSGMTVPAGGVYEGLGSAGFGLFGDPTFPGANLAGPVAINGLQYGILSAGDNTGTGNAGITASGGLIKDSVIFTLSGLADGFDVTTIHGVVFQYGTNLSEPPGGLVPVPPTVWLMGSGLVGLGLMRWRRRQQ
jgi:hypothetical protein